MSIQAIETRYKGYRFRSRLEARWAVFFDAMMIVWEYEWQGYNLDDVGCYLPDFWLPTHPGCFVEIKGEMPTDKEAIKAHALAIQSRKYDVLLTWGTPGSEEIVLSTHAGEWNRITHAQRGLVWCALAKHHGRHPVNIGGPLCQQVRNAYVAARSARFEHGETPRVPHGNS